MIRALINGGVFDWLYGTICMIPGIIIGLCFHEYAHAIVADKCGDPTPRAMGRVSLNPKAHVDWFGLVSLALIHFGWGRPVVINPRNFKDLRKDSLKVGVAGVAMNFAIATAFGILMRLLLLTDWAWMFFGNTQAGAVVWDIWMGIITINYSLMLFNLIPVPPLDGFGIISDIFNLRGKPIWQFIYKNSMIILLIFILFDIPSILLNKPLNFLVNAVVFGRF